jgi:hypothetical protein
MQTLLVHLILACAVGAVFLVARGGNWGWANYKPKPYKRGYEGNRPMFGKVFDLFWGWADYKPKDWSKRGQQ